MPSNLSRLLKDADPEFLTLLLGELLETDGTGETSRTPTNNHNIGLVRHSLHLDI
jgi:hypothetical protein